MAAQSEALERPAHHARIEEEQAQCLDTRSRSFKVRRQKASPREFCGIPKGDRAGGCPVCPRLRPWAASERSRRRADTGRPSGPYRTAKGCFPAARRPEYCGRPRRCIRRRGARAQICGSHPPAPLGRAVRAGPFDCRGWNRKREFRFPNRFFRPRGRPCRRRRPAGDDRTSIPGVGQIVQGPAGRAAGMQGDLNRGTPSDESQGLPVAGQKISRTASGPQDRPLLGAPVVAHPHHFHKVPDGVPRWPREVDPKFRTCNRPRSRSRSDRSRAS